MDPRGRTPLELAVSLGHLESARVLLRHNANVGRENANGWTGTWARGPPAQGRGRRDTGAGGARLMAPRAPVLQEAVSTGDPEMVQLVLQYRDYQRATRRLAGIPELLSKLRRVRPCRGGHRAPLALGSRQAGDWGSRRLLASSWGPPQDAHLPQDPPIGCPPGPLPAIRPLPRIPTGALCPLGPPCCSPPPCHPSAL